MYYDQAVSGNTVAENATAPNDNEYSKIKSTPRRLSTFYSTTNHFQGTSLSQITNALNHHALDIQ